MQERRKQFYAGQKVYIQDTSNKKWFPGIIVNKTKLSRFYITKDRKGKRMKRNSKFIKKINDYESVREPYDENTVKDDKDEKK